VAVRLGVNHPREREPRHLRDKIEVYSSRHQVDNLAVNNFSKIPCCGVYKASWKRDTYLINL